MAAPQTHLGITIALAWILRLKGWDFVTALVFGVGVDIDHFFDCDYIKDVVKTRIIGGDAEAAPKPGSKEPPIWLHRWPGIILIPVLAWALYHFFNIAWYIAPIFYLFHVPLDRRQNFPVYSFWYPFEKEKVVPKRWPKWTYPPKERFEFILASSLLGLEVVAYSLYVAFL